MTAGHRSLTPRERAVLDLLRRHRSNQEIADELVISIRTVESHVAAVLRKMEVTSRRSLAADSVAEPELRSALRFVEVAGSTLAVAETGAGALTLVKTATWLTQVDRDTLDSPIWSHWVRELGRRYRYVRYDPRGCGLSDRDLAGTDLTNLNLWVEDLERVVDSTTPGQVALLGVSQGGPVAIAYAVRHPERVSHLILYGTYARGMSRRDAAQDDEARLQVGLARIAWASRNGMFREAFARQFVPDAGREQIEWFCRQLDDTTTAENAPLLESAFHGVDVSDQARAVTVPTLVLHATGDRGVPFEEGRHLAGLVPAARFVPLASRNHILLAADLAFGRFLDEVDHFIGGPSR